MRDLIKLVEAENIRLKNMSGPDTAPHWRFEIYLGNTLIGRCSVLMHDETYGGGPDTAHMSIFLEDEYTGKGYGRVVYDLIEKKLAKIGRTLIPDRSLSQSAYKVWQKRRPETLVNHKMHGGRYFTEDAGKRTLGDLCEIKTNFPDADFWIVRRGTREAVGSPTRDFNPEHIGVKVTATDVLDPKYLFYVMQHLHNRGLFASEANGTLRLVSIRTDLIKQIPVG
jgi:GNAT superfamily N-acetyltransferase